MRFDFDKIAFERHLAFLFRQIGLHLAVKFTLLYLPIKVLLTLRFKRFHLLPVLFFEYFLGSFRCFTLFTQVSFQSLALGGELVMGSSEFLL